MGQYFPGSSLVKNLPANSRVVVLIPGKDALEKGMATHSRVLAWDIPQRSLAGPSL